MSATLAPTVVAASYVEPLVSFSSFVPAGYVLIILGISDAYYCAECTRLEKDRDGCPKIVNLGASRTDLFYERRRLGTSYPTCFNYMHLIQCN
jgi:PHF5-like protein